MVDLGMAGGGVSGGGSGGLVGVSPAAQQYCLKWNNHQNNLLRVFMRLLGQELFTDVTIASEGRRIKCHKVVLSACSSYFEHLFMSFNEPNQIVILKDTPYQDIVAIIEFMYKGEINVSQDRLSSLLKTAENLKVKGLAEVSNSEDKKPSPAASKLSNNNNSPAINGLSQDSAASLQQQRSALTARLAPPSLQMLGRPVSSILSDNLLNGDGKRKRGRPRTLDGPEDTLGQSFPTPRISSVAGAVTNLSPLLLAAASTASAGSTNTQTAAVAAALRLAASDSASSPMKQARLVAAVAAAAAAAQDSGSSTTTTNSLQKNPAIPSLSMSPLQAALNRPLNEKNNSTPGSPTTKQLADNQQPSRALTPATSRSSSVSGSPPPLTAALNLATAIKKEKEDENTAISDSSTPDKEPMSGGEGIGGEIATTVPPERLASWGIIKMNDYLVTGTRQQYWEELFVKHVMEAVRNKEVDMKGAAELLGVSYGTLYGRYRENFGYLKHAWNLTGRPQRKQNIWTDPSTSSILEAMRSGAMSMKQAADALGMETAMLAYHLAAKVDPIPVGGTQGYSDDELEEEELDDDEDGAGIIIGAEEEPDNEVSELMEIQPEIIVGGESTPPLIKRKQASREQFEGIVEEGD